MQLNSKLSLADNAFASLIIRSRDVELETTAQCPFLKKLPNLHIKTESKKIAPSE